MKYDHAKYNGDIPAYQGKTVDIRADALTIHLPLAERKVMVRWHDPNLLNHQSTLGQSVGTVWHKMNAQDFSLLIRV